MLGFDALVLMTCAFDTGTQVVLIYYMNEFILYCLADASIVVFRCFSSVCMYLVCTGYNDSCLYIDCFL